MGIGKRLRSAIAYCHYLVAPRLRLLGHGALPGGGRLLRERLLRDAIASEKTQEKWMMFYNYSNAGRYL